MSRPTLLALKLGARLREIRHLRSLTQVELARRTQMSSSDVSRAEVGSRMPTLPTLRRLAEALCVSVGDLLDVEANALPPELSVLLADLRAAPPELRAAALAMLSPHLKPRPPEAAEAQRAGGAHAR